MLTEQETVCLLEATALNALRETMLTSFPLATPTLRYRCGMHLVIYDNSTHFQAEKIHNVALNFTRTIANELPLWKR